jgi:glycosyltransferase involved in cell wall biosynthesis
MVMNKKVLVLTTSFPTKEFHVGMHVYNKCKHLTDKGIKVTVLAPHYHNEQFHELKDRIEITRFPYFWPFHLQKVAYNYGLPQNLKLSLLAKFQLPLFILMFFIYGLKYGKHYNIIHAHWFPAGLIGIFIKTLFKNKLVLMMHHAHKPNLLYKHILKRTDYLLTNSSYVLNITEKIYPVKNKKVIPVPVDYNRFTSQVNTKHIRNKLNIPDNSIFLFAVGRFIALKGFEYLIKAHHILINEYKKNNVFLRIAGQGYLKETYNKLIQNYKLDDYVKLIGYVPNTKIHEYYNEADIFVIPSITDKNGETEGFGVVSLEANACETPVIASKVGGILDVIEDGYNGFLVEQKNTEQMAEKINELVEDKELRREIGKNGRQKVTKEFNWDKVTSEIIKVYNKLYE